MRTLTHIISWFLRCQNTSDLPKNCVENAENLSFYVYIWLLFLTRQSFLRAFFTRFCVYILGTIWSRMIRFDVEQGGSDWNEANLHWIRIDTTLFSYVKVVYIKIFDPSLLKSHWSMDASVLRHFNTKIPKIITILASTPTNNSVLLIQSALYAANSKHRTNSSHCSADSQMTLLIWRYNV